MARGRRQGICKTCLLGHGLPRHLCGNYMGSGECSRQECWRNSAEGIRAYQRKKQHQHQMREAQRHMKRHQQQQQQERADQRPGQKKRSRSPTPPWRRTYCFAEIPGSSSASSGPAPATTISIPPKARPSLPKTMKQRPATVWYYRMGMMRAAAIAMHTLRRRRRNYMSRLARALWRRQARRQQQLLFSDRAFQDTAQKKQAGTHLTPYD